MDNAGWLIIISAAGASAWYVNKQSKPRPLSDEELDLIRPAPYSTEGQDELSPDDLSIFGEAIGLTGGSYPQPKPTEYPGLWQYDIHVNPNQWNTPIHPSGNNDAHNPNYDTKGADRMRLGTLNIKNYPDMSRAKVAADARRMGQLCSIWGAQEIQPGEDTGVVLGALGNNWGGVFLNRANPIFYRKDKWEAFDQFDIHYDRSDVHLTPKQDSAASVAFRSKMRPNLEPFAVVNTHMVVGAYNRRASVKLSNARRPIWHNEFDKYQRAIEYQLRKGRSTFYVGDFNHPSCPIPIRGGRWISNVGIDRIGFIRAKGGIRVAGFVGNPRGEIHNMNSDHSARVISAILKG